ncbi:uncharacterized protein BYT42DRAFT_501215 [Radiomyces spectabilis]|uniref:uncharacterized protein n=1 Tax=Radiomyces spectabilis TaxID=64574 RepID=UPI00221FE0A9|nr:uncharacterized protein BYT42DRAFT_501215 [Radiomyces spectabilis]KAI8371473.1 hypothetical protein BYT42DRAFT_501215 [Radiomyces spectabilis]
MPRLLCKSGSASADVVDQLKVLEFPSAPLQLHSVATTVSRTAIATHRPSIYKQYKSNNLIYGKSPRKRRHTVDGGDQADADLTLHRRLSTDVKPTAAEQSPQRYVLVTGGAGYIGSHTVLELLKVPHYSIVVMDNLVNSNLEALRRVEQLAGRSIHFVKGDVTSEVDLSHVFSLYNFWSVIHFAAIKAVGESTRIPLEYYHNNLTGSLNLLRVMKQFNVKNLVFSSSATVYGEPEMMPVRESAQLGPVTNPYGRTKLFVEEILRDVCASDPEWNVCLLRYFNPVGAHPSGLIGECPQGVPNNLLPYVIRVLQGHLPFVHVYGDDYETVDGTGVRDYIHVCDLATGHSAALKKLEEKPGCVAYNLGTGAGFSVLEIIHAMERATHRKIPYKVKRKKFPSPAFCTLYPCTLSAHMRQVWVIVFIFTHAFLCLDRGSSSWRCGYVYGRC